MNASSNEKLRDKKYKITKGKDGKDVVITYRGKLPSLYDSLDDFSFDDDTEVTRSDKEDTKH